MTKNSVQAHQVVIVGGGAAGLELASALGVKARKNKGLEVTLIDAVQTHVWKPLLHEIAAGTMDHNEELEYLAQAQWRNFQFRLGYMDGLDRQNKLVHLRATCNDAGEELIPGRSFAYDSLIIAVGSVSNTYRITGVEDNCQFLDSTGEAFKFQKYLLETFMRVHVRDAAPDQVMSIAIIGGGATGVELAAELHNVSQQLAMFGLNDDSDRELVKITLIEAADRLLPALPEKLSRATQVQLGNLGVRLLLGERVVEVTENQVKLESGVAVDADIKVWAAGIKGPDWMAELDGLETNQAQQLVVERTLQTTRDPNIFAMGDCAACPWPGHDTTVPPRAQAAHQQASLLCKSVLKRMVGADLPDYVYRDYGSLVSLGKYSTVGNLMGNLMGSVSIGGFIARMFYLSLYKMHQVSVYGYFRTGMLMMSNLFRRRVKSHIKLH